MDNFGSGYSSISSLRRFPFDKVKIDRSFVKDVCHDAEVAAIVAAIVRLGQSLGIRINAEGVEDQEQLRALRAQGCEEVQGFYLATPMPPEELESLLRHGFSPKGATSAPRPARGRPRVPADG
jgi:EAL domain-containing protein (putative c-di-GMP-specific phosphodiesterase class I)